MFIIVVINFVRNGIYTSSFPLYRARCLSWFRRRGAPGSPPSPPRRCFRTPSPSQGRGGALSGAPGAPRPPPAAQPRVWKDWLRGPLSGCRSGVFFRELGALVRGRRGEQGSPRARRGADPGQLPPAILPGPQAHTSGIPYCSGRGRVLGVTGTPTRNHQRQPHL